MTMSDYSSAAPDERPVSMQPMSEQGHGGNRQSNATMATFGAWDKGLQRNLQGVEESLTVRILSMSSLVPASADLHRDEERAVHIISSAIG
jgi:hypothetical protein